MEHAVGHPGDSRPGRGIQRRRSGSGRARGRARAAEPGAKGRRVHMKTKTDSMGLIRRRLATGVAAACVALFQAPAGAEDIDLFVQPGGDNGGVPNVLILLDNTANWNTPFTAEIAAI